MFTSGVAYRHALVHRSTVLSRGYSMRASARQHLPCRGPINILFPALSPTMETGKIVQWKPKEGDRINIGDVLFSVETDKATLDAESTDEGILAKIIKGNGSTNAVNEMVGIIAEDGEDWKNVEVPAAVSSTSASPAPTSAQSSGIAESSFELTYVGFPSVKRLLGMYGISPNDIKPTGPQNRILKGDVLKHIASKNLKPVPAFKDHPAPKATPAPTATPAPVATPAPKVTPAAEPVKPQAQAQKPAAPVAQPQATGTYTDTQSSTMRQVIAKRLTASKYTIPHGYMSREIKTNHMSQLRKQLLDGGAKLSLNDLIIKSVASALERVPAANVQWNEAAGEVKPQSTIDISVAVAIEGGLITPIIANANQKKVTDIAKEMKELAAAAKEGKLQPNQYQGMFGINEFTAVINPPQACILAIGGTKQKIEVDSEGQGQVFDTMTVTLSYDSRAVNSEDAAKFLDELSDTIQNLYLRLFL